MTPLHRALGVYRWHTNPTLGRLHQTTADHSARMCGLAIDLWGEDVPASLFRSIILHDAAEYFTGDVPWSARAAHPGLAKYLFIAESDEAWRNGWPGVSADDHPKLQFLDRLEAYLFCCDNDPAQALTAEWAAARAWISNTSAALGIWDRVAVVLASGVAQNGTE